VGDGVRIVIGGGNSDTALLVVKKESKNTYKQRFVVVSRDDQCPASSMAGDSNNREYP
jgi:hypothetical protein